MDLDQTDGTPRDGPMTLASKETPYGIAGVGHVQVLVGSVAGIVEHRVGGQHITSALPITPLGHLRQTVVLDAAGVVDMAGWMTSAAGIVVRPTVVCTGNVDQTPISAC